MVSSSEVLPVQVEILNPTNRAYQLEPEKIVLVSASGDRVKPVNDKGDALPMHALSSQTLAPGAEVKGYLYYPPGTYTSSLSGMNR